MSFPFLAFGIFEVSGEVKERRRRFGGHSRVAGINDWLLGGSKWKNPVLLEHSSTPSLHHSIPPSLHPSIPPSLHHSITPSLHKSITSSLHHSITSS
jgi:hypothetical protein